MIALFILALALAMDAFAVSLCQGAAARPTPVLALPMAGAFGLAQALMPIGGWLLGTAFATAMADYDHWVAFGLLGLLGLKMIREGFAPPDPCPPALIGGRTLFAAAIATSIDAAAAGITLPTLGVPVLLASAVIGIVTAVLCFGGALSGARLGTAFGKKAEVAGGLVLILLGVRVLAQHMGWFG